MTLFWLAIAALCLLTLWALWRPVRKYSTLEMESVQQRNVAIANERAEEIDSAFESGDISADERDQARQDLEIELADELATSVELKDQFTQAPTSISIVLLLLIPLLAFGLYKFASNYNPDANDLQEMAQEGKAPPLDEIIGRLEQAVDANPQDQQGLFLLAQSYVRLGRFAEASQRFDQLIKITPPNADLLVAYVDASVMANDRQFTQPLEDKLHQALELDPENINGLWLAGISARQLGRPEDALRYWLTVQPKLSASPTASQELSGLIDRVSEEIGSARAQQLIAEITSNIPASAPVTAGSEAVAGAGLTVRVSLSPELQDQVESGDTVFIFARAKSGPPMPLAASRQPVSALPVTVALDDSMALIPNMKLSSFDQVLVGARISKSGQAIAQAGDLESELVTTPNAAEGTIELVISKRHP